MSKNKVDHSGETINDNLIIKIHGKNKFNQPIYEVKCHCGNTFYSLYSNLKKSKGCGCLRKGRNYKSYNKTHVNGTHIAIMSNLPNKNNKLKLRKGVNYIKKSNSYKARIMFKGIEHHLGYFSTVDLAIKAREKAEEKYYTPEIKNWKEQRLI